MTHEVKTLAQLEALYGVPAETSLRKVTHRLTPEYRQMIASSPFFALATIGAGGLDCSPRGDACPAVSILDDHTIAIPDRRGNNRLDSLRNLVEDPRCALLFLIPGISECIRINASATISTDPDLLQSLAHDKKNPTTVIVATIQELYFQCARAITRAGLWNPELHRNRGELPTAGDLTKSAFAEFDAKSYDAALAGRQAKTLY